MTQFAASSPGRGPCIAIAIGSVTEDVGLVVVKTVVVEGSIMNSL